MLSDTTCSPSYQTKDTTFTKIFVGGLPYHTTDSSLRNFFERFGEIEEAVVITDRQTGKSRGYGFVTMARKDDALQAIRDPNPCIDGRKANVNLAVLGAKPRVIAGVANASNLLAMANGDSGLLNPLMQQVLPQTSMLGPGQVNPNILQNLLAMGGNMPLFPQANSRLLPQTSQMSLSGYQGNPYVNPSMAMNPFALAQMLYANNQNAQFLNPYTSEGQVHPSMLMSLNNSGQQPMAAPANMLGLPTGQIYTENLLMQGGDSATRNTMQFQTPSVDLYGQQLTSTASPSTQPLKHGMNGTVAGSQTTASNWPNQPRVFQMPSASNTNSMNGSTMAAHQQNNQETTGADLLSSTMFESLQAGRSNEVTEMGVPTIPSNGMRSFI